MSAPRRVFEIDILSEDDRWPAVPHLQNLLERAIKMAMRHIETRVFEELSLAFLDDAKVQALNRDYRGKDKPTNVLSFPANAGPGYSPMLGDIVFAYETVMAEATARGIPLDNHITHLFIHGFYHLQGYDHETNDEAEAMEALERAALADLGISDPYAKDELL